MSKEIIDIDFKTQLAAQDRIKGCFISGQKFEGKIHSCANDFFSIVELSVENISSGRMEKADGDLITLRQDAVMYFDKTR